MSNHAISNANPVGLLSALDALRSPGNIALAAIASIVALALLAAAGALQFRGGASAALALLLVPLAWLIWQTGYSAVTARSIEAALGEPVSGFLSALASGFFAAIKVLLAMLMMLVLLLVAMIGAGLLFLVTQIPGIGPALDFVVFPVVALILGVALYALLFIAAPIAAVAASDGRSVFGIVATAWLTMRKRLFDTAIRGALVGMIAVFVAGLALIIITMGVSASGAIKAAVQVGQGNGMSYGGNMDFMRAGGLMGLFYQFRSIGASSAILYLLALSLGLIVYVSGWVLIFNDTARDLDPAALEAKMRASAEDIQRKAREAKDKAEQMARDRASRARDNAGGP